MATKLKAKAKTDVKKKPVARTRKKNKKTIIMETPEIQPVTTPGPQFPQEREHHTQLFVSLGVVVLLIIVFALGWWFVDNKTIESVETLETGEVQTTARDGKVVPNFPDELFNQGNDTTVERSYSLVYENGVEQPVLVYRSDLKMPEVVRKTVEHFESQGWIFVKDADPMALAVTNFYVVKDGNEANVTFVQKDGFVTIEISFIDNSGK
jgi:hypothetical protein